MSFITHPSLTMTYKSNWIRDFLRCSKGELQRSKKLTSSYLILKAKDFEGGDKQKKNLLSFLIVSSAEVFLKILFSSFFPRDRL